MVSENDDSVKSVQFKVCFIKVGFYLYRTYNVIFFSQRGLKVGGWMVVVVIIIKMFPLFVDCSVTSFESHCLFYNENQTQSAQRRKKNRNRKKLVRNCWSRPVWTSSITNHFQGTSQTAAISIVTHWKVADKHGQCWNWLISEQSSETLNLSGMQHPR